MTAPVCVVAAAFICFLSQKIATQLRLLSHQPPLTVSLEMPYDLNWNPLYRVYRVYSVNWDPVAQLCLGARQETPRALMMDTLSSFPGSQDLTKYTTTDLFPSSNDQHLICGASSRDYKCISRALSTEWALPPLYHWEPELH